MSALTACGAGPPPGPPPGTAQRKASGTPRPVVPVSAVRDDRSRDDQGRDDQGLVADERAAFLREVALVRGLAERFWATTFWRKDLRYAPVAAVHEYRGTPGPWCGGRRGGPRDAYFCPDGPYIAYDGAWLEAGYREVGYAAVHLVIAHEFAHHARHLAGSGPDGRAGELQADCHAGAFLRYVLDHDLIEEKPGELTEVVHALNELGDPAAGWWSPAAHGTVRQRLAAYLDGYEHGVDGC